MVAKVTFEILQQRLLSRLAERVSSGDFSERQLAAKLGISQPQIHRLLKGTRRLTQDVADSILSHLDLSIVDLLESVEVATDVEAANPPRKGPDRQQAYGNAAQRRHA